MSVTIATNSTSLKATVTAATIAVITKTSVVVVIPVYYVFISNFLVESTNFNSSMKVTFYFKQIYLQLLNLISKFSILIYFPYFDYSKDVNILPGFCLETMFLSNNDNFSFIRSLWFPIDMFHLGKIEFLLVHYREESFLSQSKNFCSKQQLIQCTDSTYQLTPDLNVKLCKT